MCVHAVCCLKYYYIPCLMAYSFLHPPWKGRYSLHSINNPETWRSNDSPRADSTGCCLNGNTDVKQDSQKKQSVCQSFNHKDHFQSET